ncbi:MAG: hypothetical protein M0006_04660 [Magnetospirillum sp.]|nr:hypothetical protein [Magnetospirillum sp.]
MGILYIATSKTVQEWGSDVGLGKNLYRVGFAESGTPEDALAAGPAGATDWKVLLTAEAEGPETVLLDRLARKEKLVDPNYYPRLRGATGIVRANLTAVENAMLVALALENREPPKNFKVKPVDVARHLVNNALK